MQNRRITIVIAVLLLLAFAVNASAQKSDRLFQVALLQSLMQGEYDGVVKDIINKLKQEAYFTTDTLDTVEALKQISSIEFVGEKRGNIYEFDIPEDEDLLDWDATLGNQSKKIKPILMDIINAINNNPAKFIAMGLAKDFKNAKAMQAKLQPLRRGNC